jgi:(1->4)-alpha-D-glucan 1-alpha-D-glucosylmutase
LRATYRLQLTPNFGFDSARDLLPYLAQLGVSHLYLSPIMTARHGSTHGYDVTDPARVSEELGGEERFRELAHSAHAVGLDVIVDFVPNHMAIGDENPYWRGEQRRMRIFDIDRDSGWHRRFFTIDELAGVRDDHLEVVDETHAKVLALVSEGLIDGLRIDHPDGLADPKAYLERLRARGVERIWVEKILEQGEQLRDWPVQGTTGYEFANDVTTLFLDGDAESTMTEIYARFTGLSAPYATVRDDAKREQVRAAFAPELAKLRSLYDSPALEEAVAALDVYRTYVQPYEGRIEAEDREILASVRDESLRRVLLLEEPGHEEFVVRFQQTSGPVMAKGVEDTAFYRYLRLTALNEVGGDPGRFSLPVADFHRANAARAQRFPNQMLASQTHDTKRSGDVRARIVELAAHPSQWEGLVRHWREVNGPLRSGPGPDANEEYLIYQTLVGAWPIDAHRLSAYLEKALREAKRNTDWAAPNQEWETSVKNFVTALYDHEPFRRSFDPFAAQIAEAGERTSLAALLLRLTCPGVGDIYEGDELWSLNLVDPDNRRPVDWEERRRALAMLLSGAVPDRDLQKIYIIRETLALRARRPEAFAGGYEPIPAAPGICAFTREGQVTVIVAVKPEADPGSVELPEGHWKDLLTGLGPSVAVRLLERD